mmetsp:Transcript_23346/g.40665  ORF Transcript_23346/g.40665 Transcript_23346/m.40665 type:complete len:253 (+) Transcript_23346:442-1200(+)
MLPTLSDMPHCITIARASALACWISPAGPLDTESSPHLITSAALPAIVIARFCSHWSRCQFKRSISGKLTTMPNAPPRGMMVALYTGSHFSKASPTTAWPDSWYAVCSFCSLVSTIERRSAPIITLSLADSKSSMVTKRRPTRAAISAASFTRFARSAPEKPGVPRAIMRRSTSGPSGVLRACTPNIFSRPLMSGLPTVTLRSKRPGRSSAGSSTSRRLVAARMITPSLASKPSISTSNWLRVCSRSSLPPP